MQCGQRLFNHKLCNMSSGSSWQRDYIYKASGLTHWVDYVPCASSAAACSCSLSLCLVPICGCDTNAARAARCFSFRRVCQRCLLSFQSHTDFATPPESSPASKLYKQIFQTADALLMIKMYLKIGFMCMQQQVQQHADADTRWSQIDMTSRCSKHEQGLYYQYVACKRRRQKA